MKDEARNYFTLQTVTDSVLDPLSNFLNIYNVYTGYTRLESCKFDITQIFPCCTIKILKIQENLCYVQRYEWNVN
jgi:hypothetical protein